MLGNHIFTSFISYCSLISSSVSQLTIVPLRRKDKQKILNNQEKREKNQAALIRVIRAKQLFQGTDSTD